MQQVQQIDSSSPQRFERLDLAGQRSSQRVGHASNLAEQFLERHEQPLFDRNKQGDFAQPSDLLTIILKVPKQQGLAVAREYPVVINRQRDVEDLFRKAAQLLSTEVLLEPESLILLHRQAPLDREKSLRDAEVTEDCTIYVNFRAVRNDDPKREEEARVSLMKESEPAARSSQTSH